MATTSNFSEKKFSFDGWAPPEHTVIRPEAEDILSAVESGQRLFVDGPRRCGKTTVVVNTVEGSKRPVIRIDLDGVASDEKLIERLAADMRGFLERTPDVKKKLLGSSKVKAGVGTNLFGLLNLSLEAEQTNTAQGIDRTLDSLLSALVEIARAAGAVVFIDEFQSVKSPSFKSPKEILGSFAAVSDPTRTRGEVSFIFAGSNRHGMHAIFNGQDSAFFQRAKSLIVGPIAEESIIPFLNKRLGVQVSPDVGREAYRWAEGIPGDLQRLYSYMRRFVGNRELVTAEDLKAAQQAVINDIGRTYTLSLQTLPETQLKVLDIIATQNVRTRQELQAALEKEKMPIPEANEIVNGLLKLGLLHISGRSPKLERPEPLLFHYLKDNPAVEHYPFSAIMGPAKISKSAADALERKIEKKRRKQRSFDR